MAGAVPGGRLLIRYLAVRPACVRFRDAPILAAGLSPPVCAYLLHRQVLPAFCEEVSLLLFCLTLATEG